MWFIVMTKLVTIHHLQFMHVEHVLAFLAYLFRRGQHQSLLKIFSKKDLYSFSNKHIMCDKAFDKAFVFALVFQSAMIRGNNLLKISKQRKVVQLILRCIVQI